MTVAERMSYIPHISTNILSRPRLLAKLENGLNKKLTTITAPPGYGKTTTMSEWIKNTKTPFAWITLENKDNHWLNFWGRFISGIEKMVPQLKNQEMGLYTAYEEEVIKQLLANLNKLQDPLIIILDDFHIIENESIFNNISYLLKRLPSSVHLYIISRMKPALRLSKLRINDDLNELSKEDFLVDKEELAKFDDEILNLQLTNKEQEIIIGRTKGWITGIKLAEIIIRRSGHGKRRIRDLSGKHPEVAAYFTEEVLERQSETVQKFLMQTAILTNLTSELCEGITEIPESHQLLQEIKHNNLFLFPVNGSGEAHGYSPLFREFLVAELERNLPVEVINRLHSKAGLWLQSHGDFKEAISHFIEAKNYTKALYLLGEMSSEIYFEEESIWRKVDKIPKELLFTRPKLYLMNVAILFLEGKTEKAKEYYYWAQRCMSENKLPSEEADFLHSGLLLWEAYRSYLMKDFETSIVHSKEYLRSDPDGRVLMEFGMEMKNCHSLLENSDPFGDFVVAEKHLQKLLNIWMTTKNVYFYAQLCIDYGKMLYEWNRLMEAEAYFTQAIQIGQKNENLYFEMTATIFLIKIQYATGQVEQADYLLKGLDNLIEQVSNPRLTQKLEVFIMKRNWYLGKKELVTKWALKAEFNVNDVIAPQCVDSYLFWATVLMGNGKLEQAERLLGRLLWQSQNEGNPKNVVRVLLCQSILLEKKGQVIQSYLTIEEAFCIAQKEKYLRVFLDKDKPMTSLFEKYLEAREKQIFGKTHEIPNDYVRNILNHFPLENRLNIRAGMKNRDCILTTREIEVLKCMESELSGKEIACSLNIAMSTMKTHTNNIYRKLQVNSRLQAVQRGTRLGIIDAGLS